MKTISPYVFLVGSPRSGTTILGQVLGRHPDVAHWYEPYFIWDYYFGNLEDDVRTLEQITDRIRRFIRKEFEIFRRKADAKLVVDKSPEHCFTIPFVHAVFPEAKWIHLVRDGRDVTLSINQEWQKRRKIVEQRRYRDVFKITLEMMGLQPYWRNRLQAIWFELNNSDWVLPGKYLNKSKWGGWVGWGPRFPGWREALQTKSTLEFNAMQWTKSVERISTDSKLLPRENWLEVRYERLATDPEAEVAKILGFMGLCEARGENIWSDLNPASIGRWRNAFRVDELKQIELLIIPMLEILGYETCTQTTDYRSES